MSIKAWVATAAKQKLVLQDIDLGPLGTEDVEVAVEHCGLCHSDLSVLNNDWGISQYPAILGHEVVGRVTAVGPATKGVKVGQRVGIGWTAVSCMHCRQCLSGDQHLCAKARADDSRPSGRFRHPRALPLGVGHPAAEGIAIRRGRSAPVRGHHRFQPAHPLRQADQPRWHRRHRRARTHGGQIRGTPTGAT